ncbi:MAG: hypothetical protein M1827_004463 [Pycnora praestabilis]|nr:MAG: hypothetical protein M1827_004463 [Pycnora praestabilis]
MLRRLAAASVFSLSWISALAVASTTACNNSPDLCDRSYSNITHLGAHDSPFLRDASTDYSLSGNQYYNATVQLNAGVRLLSAQVYNSSGDLHLCHSSCSLLDAGTLNSWLTTIKTWMDANPNDVVSILLVNSDNLDSNTLSTAFTSANITSYSYIPPAPSPAIQTWPTLSSLIANNTRLITFIASLDPAPTTTTPTTAPYLLDEFTFIFENPYDVTSLTNFSCVADRPASVQGNTATAISSGRMPLMNHFLDSAQAFGIETPDVGNITTTNAPSGAIGNLGGTAAGCASTWGRKPTFILVDFFDQGPAIATVDTLNGITNPVGRTNPPTSGQGSNTEANGKGATSKGVRGMSGAGALGALVVVGWAFVVGI